jgi:hypothetical protein
MRERAGTQVHQFIVFTCYSLKGSASDLIGRLRRGIGIANEKLDQILVRIEDTERNIKNIRPAELERIVNGLVEDLNALEDPILGMFDEVEQLKLQRHPDASDLYKE